MGVVSIFCVSLSCVIYQPHSSLNMSCMNMIKQISLTYCNCNPEFPDRHVDGGAETIKIASISHAHNYYSYNVI